MSESVWTRVDRHVVEAVIVLAVAALVVAPLFMSSSVGVVTALAGAVLIAGVRFSAAPPVSRSSWVLMGMCAVAVVIVVATSLLAADVTHSFFGKPGQRAGALTWIALLVLFAVMVLRARPGDLGRVLRAVSLASAVMAIAALLDVLGLFETFRFSQEAAGILESSISLGQVLALGAGCALAWAFTARDTTQHILAWGSAAVIVVAMLASGARAALVAFVLAAALVALVRLVAPRAAKGMWVFGAAVAVVAILLVAAGWILIGPAALDRADAWASVTNQRTVIWASGYGAAAQSPLLGRGADQFSGWAAWDSNPNVGLTKAGTYDPHNVLLGWLIAGGLAGLLAAGVVAGIGLGRMLVTYRQRQYAIAVAAVLTGLLAWAASLMTSWMAPIAAVFAVFVFAPLLSAGDREAGATIPSAALRQGIVGVAVATALAMLIVSAPGLEQERAWAQEAAGGSLDAAAAVDLAESSGDPSVAAVAVGMLVQRAEQDPTLAESNLELARRLEPMLAQAAPWHVDAAYAGFALQVTTLGALQEGSMDDVDAYVQVGKQADPTSGLWDYVAAVQAERLGEDARARDYAAEALDYPLPTAARTYMEELAATP